LPRDIQWNRPLASLALGTQGLSAGSRLLVVIDNHSKRIDARRRFRVTVRWVAWLVLASIACSWLFLYFDSVHQRRRAESLFADLKSLDFATAGFPAVRDIMIRNGYRPGPKCNPQNCTFLLQIMTRLPRIPLLDRKARFFYTVLPYIGIRSWVADALFEVRNGKLERSETGVGEFKMERRDSAARLKGSVIPLVAWNYSVLLSQFRLRVWPVCSIACCWRG
jgi:hypothetical protein